MRKYYTINHNLLWCLLWMAIISIPQVIQAQDKVYANAKVFQQRTTNDQYKPLVEVLNEIKDHYQVSFLYEPVTLEDKKVKVPVNYKSKVESTLSKLLEPAGLMYKRINEKTYSILSQETPTASITQELSKEVNMVMLEPEAAAETAIVERYQRPVEISVSGTITDESDSPLPGVNVLVKGTSIGTTSDASGKFTITVPDENSVLVISFIGYATQEITVGTQTSINVKLNPDITQLGEVVVVGYGTQKKTSVTGAISSVSSKDLSAQPVVNVGQALQGRVAGVTVVNNGAPGAAPIVRIRGVGTVNNANPLYVIDGFPTGDLNSINPKDIESLEVLKDASAAAIYGSRAANGVILITTKKGTNKKLSVNLESYYGVEQAWRKLDLLNTEQYIDYATELLTNADIYTQETTNPSIVIGSSVPERIKSGGLDQPINSQTSQTFRQTNTDWQDEMFRVAPIQQHKAELMGGTDKSRMFASVGYFDQEGIMEGTGYRRGDARFNSDHNISKKITFGQNFYVAYDERKVEQNAGGRTQLQHIIRSSPYFPVYNPDNYGGFFGAQGVDGSDPENPVRVAALDKQNQQRLKFLGNAYVDVKILEFLSYRFQGGVDYVDYRQRTHLPAYNSGPGGYSVRANANLNQNQQNFVSTILTNQLTFNKSFDKHNVNATVVAEQQTFTFTQTTGQGNNTQSNDIQEPVALANQTYSGNRDESALISYVARVNYDYNDKYFIGASIRRDGSSRFSPDNRWGTFPAVSAGWRLSEESFFQGTEFISELKLRGSYGLAGNFLTPGVYDYQSTISGNQIYEFNLGSSASSAGYTIRALANPDIKWETSRMTNIGVDVGFLSDKFTLTAEYFNTRTTDMILPRPIPLSYGYDTPPTANVGEVENKGFELQLGYTKSEGDFNFNISGNISAVRNKVINLGSEGTTIQSGDWYGDNLTLTKVGEPIGYFNGFVTDGLFQAGEPHPLQPAARAGDIKFKDVNGDGQLNADDKQNIGHFLPDFSYGINFSGTWKGFDATLFLQGVSGNEIYSVVKYELEGMSRLFNSGTAVLNRWTPENTNTNVPRAVSGDPNRNGRASDRFIEDGSYFRIKNLTIGYSVPSSIFSSLTNSTLTKLRIYMTTQNLLTLTKYKSGYDPEIGNRNDISVSNNPKAPLTTTLTQGIDYGQFPQSRSIVFGLQIGF
jgi:TonB-dependent starch-binding outer membrane protein SusC